MKTFAHTNAAGDILSIGMIYFEDGSYTPEVAAFVAEHGEDAGIIAYGEKVKRRLRGSDGADLGPDPAVTTIVIETVEMPGGSAMGYDKTFRGAFKRGAGKDVGIDIPKAKTIAHGKRRAARAAEFAPLDIEATIPAKAAQAEAKRQAIRDKYDVMQTNIDAATTVEALKAIVVTL